MIARFTTRFPTLSASLVYAIATLLAFNQFFAGKVLLWEMSDQRGGYPARLIAAEHFKEFGGLPEWSPYIFGGFPFISNTGFGDTLFPTALLRLIMPVDQGMAFGFILFVFLAGVFAFLFLRSLNLSWGASFIGGAAYMFSGMILSMPSPGHDGKLYVSALLPLGLMFLYRATTRGDWRQYLYFGVTVGLCLLSPHFQATYYFLMAAGFFWFFMIFLSKEKAESELWWRASLLFGGALLIGFAIAAVQLLPFQEYVPFSPRGADHTWAEATSWSMPPEEIIGAILPGFNGATIKWYYGRNLFKLHSDYFGIVAVILAIVSFQLVNRRRLAWFFVFLAVYALLFGFGGHTPFYSIPFTLLPGIAKTRAPSIIFFLVSFSVTVLTAFGAEYLLSRSASARNNPKEPAKSAKSLKPGLTSSILSQLDPRLLYSLVAVVFVTVLAVIGGWRPVMDSLASSEGFMSTVERAVAVEANYAPFTQHMILATLFTIAAVTLLLPKVITKLGREAAALLIGLVVLMDLYAIERSYLIWSPRASQIMPADEIVSLVKADTTLHRVLPIQLSEQQPYSSNYFMGHRVRAALGYNSFELHAYDELLGKSSGFVNMFSPKLWQLIGVKYVVMPNPAPCPADRLSPQLQAVLAPVCAALIPVGDSLRTYQGGTATVYRFANALPYAFLVPRALKVDASAEQIAGALLAPNFDARGLIVIPMKSTVGSDSVGGLGTPIANNVSAQEIQPGKLHFELEKPAEQDAFLYVAENYYPAWHAKVDGKAVTPIQAQVALMAVPIPAGAKVIDLEFSQASYHTGFLISVVTFLGVLMVAALAWVKSRRKRATV